MTSVLHADGTVCRHEGKPQASVHDDDGPLCPAGQQVTHVCFNGRVLTIAQAYTAFSSLAETIVSAFAPVAETIVSAFAPVAEFASKVAADPNIRAMAAARGVGVETESEEDAAQQRPGRKTAQA